MAGDALLALGVIPHIVITHQAFPLKKMGIEGTPVDRAREISVPRVV